MKSSKSRQLIAPTYLLACLLLGGSTQTIWFAAALQLIALMILGWAAVEGRSRPLTAEARVLGLLVAAMLVLVMIQFLPLPPLIWSHLPGRERVVEGLALLNLEAGWQTLSLAPYETLTTVLPLLPPLAMLAAMVVLRAYTTTGIAIALFIGVLCSLVLGMLQIGSVGSASDFFYIQAEHNDGTASGFFANSNHLATLLLINVPFLIALATKGMASRNRKRSNKIANALFGLSGLALVLLGLFVNGSLAGLGLVIPVLALSILITPSISPVWRRVLLSAAALGFTAFVLIVFTPLGRQLIPGKNGSSITTRADFNATGWAVARDYLPMGSGLGTFARVYRIKENPRLIDPAVFVNHAHDDYLEVLIEAGIPGVSLILLFFLWWARTVRNAVKPAAPDAYALAGAIASAAILAHSIVDYPLRTSAISVCFAASLALLVTARRNGAGSDDLRPTRHVTIG